MCGIWAYLLNSKNTFTSKCYKENLQYLNSIQFRGPDKTNLIKMPKFYLGFHRLAIHDLSPLGDQPFIYQDGPKMIYVMCNGEIYNYKELINEFNLELSSDSDCEVIYHILKEYNYDPSKALSKIKGEFAFIVVIHDLNDNDIKYIVARDRIGVRPLFMGYTDKGLVFSSVLKGLSGLAEDVLVFKPGTYLIYENDKITMKKYYDYDYPLSLTPINNLNDVYKEITSRLIEAVRVRMDSDHPIGCLLSGGLDSSLVAAILVKILGIKDLHTFNIAMENGTDVEYARLVAKHLDTKHSEVKFTPKDGLNTIPDVINATETFDITTIRASVGQFLLSKYIREYTDIRVVLNGDGADEVEMGYLYFYNHPTLQDAHNESCKLIREIHLYDGLRVDRCISYHGLEARLPFLDDNFVDYYMSIPPQYRVPTKDRMEKQLIRDAFATLYPDLLPKDVLYRVKEAFSDAVSSKEKSWYQMIQDRVDTIVTNEEYEKEKNKYKHVPVVSKESFYYREYFNSFFNNSFENKIYDNVIPHYWLPNWNGNILEPSARILSIYNNK